MTLISTVVLTVLGVALAVGYRYIHSNPYRMVGWKGEMELLPEITIEPDVIMPQASPRPRETKDAAAVNVARTSDFETTPSAKAAKPRDTEPDILDLEARGEARSKSTQASRPVSYSESYVILRTVRPKYPEHERNAGIEGNVTVELLVNEQGLVAQANVL
ncbi:MAG TPA: energy transducer TonB, partial [Candidatus Krumholzibacteria bacterium]|nr:energy transducer TonB [Candidatus Krumholzibacteria bacterium]